MTNYKGICVFTINGTRVNVKVRDSQGNELFISIEDYVSRGVEPSLDALPECEQAK